MRARRTPAIRLDSAVRSRSPRAGGRAAGCSPPAAVAARAASTSPVCEDRAIERASTPAICQDGRRSHHLRRPDPVPTSTRTPRARRRPRSCRPRTVATTVHADRTPAGPTRRRPSTHCHGHDARAARQDTPTGPRRRPRCPARPTSTPTSTVARPCPAQVARRAEDAPCSSTSSSRPADIAAGGDLSRSPCVPSSPPGEWRILPEPDTHRLRGCAGASIAASRSTSPTPSATYQIAVLVFVEPPGVAPDIGRSVSAETGADLAFVTPALSAWVEHCRDCSDCEGRASLQSLRSSSPFHAVAERHRGQLARRQHGVQRGDAAVGADVAAHDAARRDAPAGPAPVDQQRRQAVHHAHRERRRAAAACG